MERDRLRRRRRPARARPAHGPPEVAPATIVTPSPTGPSLELVARALRGEEVPPSTLMPPRVFPALEELSAATA